MSAKAAPASAAMPAWAEPQLATLTRDRFSSPDWIFERKLDGERCLAFVGAGPDQGSDQGPDQGSDQGTREGAGPDGVRLLTRSKRDISRTFPEIAGALRGQRDRHPAGLILDG